MLDLDVLFDPDQIEARLWRTYGTGPTVEALSDDKREAYEERAAIMEFDGGLPRETAEIKALLHIARLMEKTGGGVTC